VRQFIVDTTPLRESFRFRRLFVGQAFAYVGRQMTVVAVPYQAFELTGSTLIVGTLGFVQFVPLIAASILGGPVIDAVDRRRVIVISQLLLAGTAAGLAVNAWSPSPALWPLFVLSGINAALSAIDGPARVACMPTILGRDLLVSGFALSQILSQVATGLGPALAGVAIAYTGLAVTYGFEAVCFVLAAVAMTGIGPLIPEGGTVSAGLDSIVEGWRFLRPEKLIQSLLVIDLNAMVFGMPRALFPAIGTEVLGGDASTVGLLFAAPGVGSFLAAMGSGWVGRVRRAGRVVVVAVLVWGATVALFGLTSNVLVAIGLLAAAGAADVISAIFRNAILQLEVPDQLRGRVTAFYTAVVGGGPRLGDLEAGAVASLTSLRFSVVSGGVACILGALAVARFMPQLWNYETEAAD
jgi:MFS family permease